MTILELQHVTAAPLFGLSLTLGPGHHAVLGTVADGSATLVELVAGLRVPRRGRVLLGGEAPARTPALRRRVGSLLSHEPPPAAAAVGDWVRHALGLRGDQQSASAALGESGLGAWQTRRVSSLSPAERRSVAMALALSLTRPLALVLFEPLANLPGLSAEDTVTRLNAAVAAGAPVLSVTANPADATRLSDSVWLLEGGRIVRHVAFPSTGALAPGSAAELIVDTDQPRALLGALAAVPAIRAVGWDGARAAGQLHVSGDDVSEVALAVMQAACQTGAQLGSLITALPDLDQVRAASAGLARGAYESAYRLGRDAGAARAALPPDRSPP